MYAEFRQFRDVLNKRGYRTVTGEAPINEVLAAGMIFLSDWKGDCAFVDPMCGSGTFLVEAAMIAGNIPPQTYRREFSFQRRKTFDKELWEEVIRESKAKIKEFDFPIIGYDIDPEAIKIAKGNIMNARLSKRIMLAERDFSDLIKPADKGILMMNPPYDERLEISDINAFYKSIGDRMKKEFTGWEGWIISSNKEALKNVGLRPSRKIMLFNGSLECKFHKYEMYSGSKKAKKQPGFENQKV